MADELDIAIQETLTVLTTAKTLRQGMKALFALVDRLGLDEATNAYLNQIAWAADAEELRDQLAVALSAIEPQGSCAIGVHLDGLNATSTRQMVASVDESDIDLASAALASAYEEVQCASLWDYTICLGYVGLAVREALETIATDGVRFEITVGFVGGDWFPFGSVTDGAFEPHLDDETRRIYFKTAKPKHARKATSPVPSRLDTQGDWFLAAVTAAPREPQIDGDSIEDVFRRLSELPDDALGTVLPELASIDLDDLEPSAHVIAHAELSAAYRRAGDSDQALHHFREAERLFRNPHDDPYGMVELCEADVYFAGRALGVRSEVSPVPPSPLDELFDVRDSPGTPIEQRATAADRWLDLKLPTLSPEDRTVAAMNVARMQHEAGNADVGKWMKLVDGRLLTSHDAHGLWKLGEIAWAQKLYRDEVETALAGLSEIVCGNLHHPAIAIRGAILPLNEKPPSDELAWAVDRMADAISKAPFEHSWSAMAAACTFAEVYLAANRRTEAHAMLDFAVECAPDVRGADFAAMHERLATLLARAGRSGDAGDAITRLPLKQRAVGEVVVLCVGGEMDQVRDRFRKAKSDRERFVIAMVVLQHGR